MKKYKKIAYLFLILIIVSSAFAIYKVSGKDENINIESKAKSETQYINAKLINLFNELNNIKFDGYTISSTNINQDNTDTQSSEQGSSSSGGSATGKSKESSQNGQQSGQESSSSKQKNQQYLLESTGILNKKDEINWEQIKKQVEDIYPILSSLTLDLYKTNIKQQDILDFNSEYDNLIKAVKNENKEETLNELSKLYEYIPKFAEGCLSENKEICIYKTKNYLFKAYSILDSEDWGKIETNINQATQEFTKLLTNIEKQDNKNQYNINKAYIMINEMQNSVTLQDKEIFLIKYKNLLEELEKI